MTIEMKEADQKDVLTWWKMLSRGQHWQELRAVLSLSAGLSFWFPPVSLPDLLWAFGNINYFLFFLPIHLGAASQGETMSRAWNEKYVSCYLPPALWKVPSRNEMSNLNLTNLPWHQGGKPGRLGKSAAFCRDGEGSGRPLGLTDVCKIKEHLSIILRDADKTSITQKIVPWVKVVFYFFVAEWIRK